MFIPVWLVVLIVIWAGFSCREREIIFIAIVVLSVVGVGLIALTMFAVFALHWWETAVPTVVKGWIGLACVVGYIYFIGRGIVEHQKITETMTPKLTAKEIERFIKR
ncbi:hypothetical protein NF324_002198 [Salmonella enterica]|nr:hypothetical protein [Salmonella enterica]